MRTLLIFHPDTWFLILQATERMSKLGLRQHFIFISINKSLSHQRRPRRIEYILVIISVFGFRNCILYYDFTSLIYSVRNIFGQRYLKVFNGTCLDLHPPARSLCGCFNTHQLFYYYKYLHLWEAVIIIIIIIIIIIVIILLITENLLMASLLAM